MIRETIFTVLDGVAFVLAFFGVVIIIYGALYGLYHLVLNIVGQAHKAKGLNIDHIRLEFGRDIILALEFIVAADIIETILEPDYYDIGLLGALVVIRVTLSYFLNKELVSLSPPERDKLR